MGNESKIVRLENNAFISPQIVDSNPCQAKWVCNPTVQGAISHHLVPTLSTSSSRPTLHVTYVPRQLPRWSIEKVFPKKSLTKTEEQIYVKNAIATSILDVLSEEEPEIVEAILDILWLLHKGKLKAGLAAFRKLTATESNLLSKFNHHLRMLNALSDGDDPIEFGGDLTKTKQALFAIAYKGCNANGKPNQYFSITSMNTWFSDLSRTLKE